MPLHSSYFPRILCPFFPGPSNPTNFFIEFNEWRGFQSTLSHKYLFLLFQQISEKLPSAAVADANCFPQVHYQYLFLEPLLMGDYAAVVHTQKNVFYWLPDNEYKNILDFPCFKNNL